MAKYHVHWFAVVIKYCEGMVCIGQNDWVCEEKKWMNACGCPDFKTNVEKNMKTRIKQLITGLKKLTIFLCFLFFTYIAASADTFKCIDPGTNLSGPSPGCI